MIKKTLYFGNPAYLSLRLGQLVIKLPEVERSNMTGKMKAELEKTIPIEDIGVVVLDHKQITITQGLLAALLENTTAVITCNERRMPNGLLLPLEGNTIQNERFRKQIEITIPQKKQIWQQTIVSKIKNQAFCLQKNTVKSFAPLYVMAKNVRSGDPDNYEAQAAAYYWKNIFEDYPDFVRDKEGTPPNNLLNYGYAILRAIIARALVVSGLLPVYGIHHHNKYNAYCLADDIMEPYRPFIDDLVIFICHKYDFGGDLTTDIKRELLCIPTLDVRIKGKRSPLLIAAAQTTASLAKCFNGESKTVLYPEFP